MSDFSLIKKRVLRFRQRIVTEEVRPFVGVRGPTETIRARGGRRSPVHCGSPGTVTTVPGCRPAAHCAPCGTETYTGLREVAGHFLRVTVHVPPSSYFLCREQCRTNAFQRGAREGAARKRLIALGRREAATLSNHADRDHRLPTHLATRSVPLFFVLVATSRDWAAPPAFGSTPAKERAGPSNRGSMHTHLAAYAAWQLHPARDGCSYVSAVPRVEACGAPGTPGSPVAEGAPALGVGARRILWQHLASQGLRWLCRPAA